MDSCQTPHNPSRWAPVPGDETEQLGGGAFICKVWGLLGVSDRPVNHYTWQGAHKGISHLFLCGTGRYIR
ncbi:hypothetical protein XENTR_v10017402 [Xenopus tropicalis]|nr:hypothetical protein XENTR_v10017402 [Xenopus tropicalis]